VTTALGLLGVAIFIPSIVGLAAGMTWIVVKVSPSKKPASDSNPA
jgi:hypothetical protein